MDDSYMRLTTQHSKQQGTRGFTLVEVMIALFIFSLLMVMFTSSLLVAKSASTMNGQYAQAISLAQHKMDQLRAVGYGGLTYSELSALGIIDAAPTTTPYSFVSASNDDQVPNYIPHPVKATVDIQAYGPDPRVKVITITIVWKSNAKRANNSQVTIYGQIAQAN